MTAKVEHAHLARHVLERILAADPDPSARVDPAARVHLASCDRCGVRKRALEVALARHLRAQPAAAVAAEVLVLAAAEQNLPKPSAWKRWLRR